MLVMHALVNKCSLLAQHQSHGSPFTFAKNQQLPVFHKVGKEGNCPEDPQVKDAALGYMQL